MSFKESLLVTKHVLLKRLGHVASKKFALLRMVRLRRLTKRLIALDRVLESL